MTKRCRFDFGVVLQENSWVVDRIEKLDINDICSWCVRQYEDTMLFEYSEKQERENYVLLLFRNKEADSFFDMFRTIAIPRKEYLFGKEYVKKIFNLLSNLILETKNIDIERDLLDYINTKQWTWRKIAFIDALFNSLKGIIGEKTMTNNIEESLKSFAKLPDDWNSYGIKSFSEQTLKNAELFLAKLKEKDAELLHWQVFPTARDSVQFEKEVNGEYFEIEIYEDHFAFYKEKKNCSKISTEIDSMFSSISLNDIDNLIDLTQSNQNESLLDITYNDFVKTKDEVLNKLYLLASKHFSSFAQRNDPRIKLSDVSVSLKHSIMSVYLWEMYSVVVGLSNNEENKEKLNKVVKLLDNGIDSVENFAVLTSVLLDYKHVHCFENVINEIKDLC